MSRLKKTAKVVFIKSPLKVIALPAQLVVSKTLRSNHKNIKEAITPANAVMCPFCGVDTLKPVDMLHFSEPSQNEVPPSTKGHHWQCETCENYITVKNDNAKEVKAYIERHGRKLYERGRAYEFRQQALQSGELAHLVNKRVTYGKVLFAFSLPTLPMFLYGAYKGAIVYSIAMLLFGVLMGLTGIINCYRAWQQYTDSVFTDDPRAQFIWFFFKRNWFLSPYNEAYEENLYFRGSLPNSQEYKDTQSYEMNLEDETDYVDEDEYEYDDLVATEDLSNQLEPEAPYDAYDDDFIADLSQLSFYYLVPRYRTKHHVNEPPVVADSHIQVPNFTQLMFYPFADEVSQPDIAKSDIAEFGITQPKITTLEQTQGLLNEPVLNYTDYQAKSVLPTSIDKAVPE